jgi:homeobox protein cut-like
MARDRCQALTADLERSKADNVKLYERMRFVQDYSQDRPGKGRSGKKVILDAGLSVKDTLKSQ